MATTSSLDQALGMGLRRQINYKWRLFFPLVILLWFTIAAMVVIQYDREKAYRSDITRQQLEFINKRVISAYEHGVNLASFIKFVEDYFDQSVYEAVRVSVYNIPTKKLITSIGEPIKMNKTDADKRPNFFYAHQTSKDGQLIVYTAMPYTVSLIEAMAWDRGDVDTLNSYFGYTIQNNRGKPTNSEFIAMIADNLRLKYKIK